MTPRIRALALAPLLLLAVPALAQNQPGHVLSGTLVTDGSGGLPSGSLDDEVRFGWSVTVVGDVDGDDVQDLAVGAPRTSVGPDVNLGAVWILFMNADGTVRDAVEIDDGALPGPSLDAGDEFGAAVAPAGDLNGDTIPDLWVGAPGDDDGGPTNILNGPGSIYAVHLQKTGAVKSVVKIGRPAIPALGAADAFGFSVAVVGDLYKDGGDDLVVGAPYADGAGAKRGSVWVVDLGPNGSFEGAQRYSDDGGAFVPTLTDNAQFGSSVAGVGDLDGNGTPDFAAGAPADDVVAPDDGSVWIYLTGTAGDIKGLVSITPDDPAFLGLGPQSGDRFGSAITSLGDVDADGDPDLAVGADGSSTFAGAVRVLRLNDPTSGPLLGGDTVLDENNGFVPFLVGDFDGFGSSVCGLGDWDGDGRVDMVVGLPGSDSGGPDDGAIGLLMLRGPTFEDLGHELWGSSQPKTMGFGSLVDGEFFSLVLEDGPAFGSAAFVLGVAELNLPFRGGVIVPTLNFILYGVPLNSAGRYQVDSFWPSGIPLGSTLYVQWWMLDPGAVLGWAASNGLALIGGA